MKKRTIIGFLLVIFLSACTSSINEPTTMVDVQQPIWDAQQAMESTRESYAMETVIALEQLKDTPTPEPLANLPKPWTDITTRTPDQISIASITQPMTAVKQGPGFEYRIACYVDQGTQLRIIGRYIDARWLRVSLGQGQTCFTLDVNLKRTDIIPNPSMQLWVWSSTCTISGDLSGIPIISPAGTPTPYGAVFLWNDRFYNSEQDQAILFERKGFPISFILTGAGLISWLGMTIRSSIAFPRS